MNFISNLFVDAMIPRHQLLLRRNSKRFVLAESGDDPNWTPPVDDNGEATSEIASVSVTPEVTITENLSDSGFTWSPDSTVEDKEWQPWKTLPESERTRSNSCSSTSSKSNGFLKPPSTGDVKGMK